jgi:sensor histidine kinase YesM
MSEAVIVAVLSLIGTLGGTFGGILTANKLTTYRIEQLEKKVEKHNNVIERVYQLEKNEAVMEEEIKVANHRIEDLENQQQ